MTNNSFVKYRECIINNMEWTNEKYLNFIEDYKNSTVLWDIRNPNYKNNSMKRKILNCLAEKYGMDEGSLRKKIKNLRSAFHREHHRLTNKMKGEEIEGDDVRKWFAYDALKFILDVTGPFVAKREELSFSAEDSIHQEEPEDDHDSFDVSTQYIQLPLIHEQPESRKTPVNIPNPVHVRKLEDEYDLFGRSMTVQLRKMPELVALELMQKMQAMVFNARKQLSKGKVKRKMKAKRNTATTNKKQIYASPTSHMSSPQSSPCKLETLSPEADTTRVCDDRDFSYEYVTTVEEDEDYAEGNDNPETTVLKRQLKRRGSKSIDPLDVKQNRLSLIKDE